MNFHYYFNESFNRFSFWFFSSKFGRNLTSYQIASEIFKTTHKKRNNYHTLPIRLLWIKRYRRDKDILFILVLCKRSKCSFSSLLFRIYRSKENPRKGANKYCSYSSISKYSWSMLFYFCLSFRLEINPHIAFSFWYQK